MSNNYRNKDSMCKYLFDAINILNKTIISNKNINCQLEKEFKSCDNYYNNTIDKIKIINDSVERQNLIKLKEKKEKLQKDIQIINNKINDMDQNIVHVENAISDLEAYKDKLNHEINNRPIIVTIIKYVFGDTERSKIQNIQSKIQKKIIDKDVLVITKKKLDSKKTTLISNKKSFEKKLSDVTNKIKQINDAKLLNARKRKDLLYTYKIKKENIKIRKQEAHHEFEIEWISALQNLDKLCSKIRQRQPHLNNLTVDNINNSMHFPDSLAFGRLHLTYQNWRGYVPRLIPFLFTKALWLPDKDTDLGLIHQLLIRLMHCMPIGTVEIIAADPLRLGTSLDPFLPLLGIKQLFPNQRLLTRSDELENTLALLTNYIENLIQYKFNDKTKNWLAYNIANNNNPLKYKVLLVFGIPEQLTDKSNWYIRRLLQHGPSCGVLPILTIYDKHPEDRKFIELRKAVDEYCNRMDFIIPAKLLKKNFSEISVVEEQEFWPDKSELTEFMTLLSEKYALRSKFSKNLTELWGNSDYWSYDSVHGIHVPIGWTIEGKVVSFSIGGINTEHHALLAGRSGSGKSNLLHILIHSLCHSYSPSELNIYLLDYKQGTEFNVYASPPLPQLALVATEGDPEYGVTVLEHLISELEKRARMFKKIGIQDFHEYRNTSGNILPRIILIVDEFQILFSEERQIAIPAEKFLNQLLRQGRAYGIHILLATQTLKGIQSISMSQLISQIGCRVALACNEEDSAMILGNSNWEASKLNSPPEGIINNSNGVKSANLKFIVPFADKKMCKDHIANINQITDRTTYRIPTKIFNGAELPNLPKSEWFKSNINKKIQLHLGEKLNFEAELFSLTLANRTSSNLLISGNTDVIHDGLLISILQSLNFSEIVDEIIYLNGYSEVPDRLSKYSSINKEVAIYKYDSVNDLNLKAILNQINNSKRILIIDGLDLIKEFHSSPTTFRPLKKEESLSPLETIKKILEDGPINGTYVIAFSDNWRRCNTMCKELLSFFEMRIGFCMNEDDAGTFINGIPGKIKGIEKDNRAIFTDRLKNQITFFRPYIVGENFNEFL